MKINGILESTNIEDLRHCGSGNNFLNNLCKIKTNYDKFIGEQRKKPYNKPIINHTIKPKILINTKKLQEKISTITEYLDSINKTKLYIQKKINKYKSGIYDYNTIYEKYYEIKLLDICNDNDINFLKKNNYIRILGDKNNLYIYIKKEYFNLIGNNTTLNKNIDLQIATIKLESDLSASSYIKKNISGINQHTIDTFLYELTINPYFDDLFNKLGIIKYYILGLEMEKKLKIK